MEGGSVGPGRAVAAAVEVVDIKICHVALISVLSVNVEREIVLRPHKHYGPQMVTIESYWYDGIIRQPYEPTSKLTKEVDCISYRIKMEN